MTIKLFKNDVGRPSNEILKKRKRFIICMIIGIMLLIVSGMFILNHFNIIKLRGLSSYQLGDVNLDGKVSEEDAQLILGYKAGNKVLTKQQLSIADFNKDKKVDTKDSKSILQSLSFKRKDEVRLYTTEIYSSSTSKKVKAIQTGTYYIWNSTIKNGRIRITTKKPYAGNIFRITGWVDINTIQKINKNVNSSIFIESTSKPTTTKKGDKKVTLGSGWYIEVPGVNKPSDFTITSSNQHIVYPAGKAINKAYFSAVNPGRTTITIKVNSSKKTYTYNYVVSPYVPLNLQEQIGYSDEQVKSIGTINDISIYEARWCMTNSDAIDNVDKYKQTIANLEKYQKRTIKRIYFLDEFIYNTVLALYNSYYPNSVGAAKPNSGFTEIFIKCSYYEPQVLIHEIAHAIDNRYGTYKQLARVSDIDPMASLYNKFSPWNSSDPLRKESYASKSEFFADAYTTHLGFTNYKYSNELKSAMNNVINDIKKIGW